MKTCNKCNTEFPLTDEFFGRRNDSSDGYRNDCKGCVSKRRSEWHIKNREDQLVKMKQYSNKKRDDLIYKKRQYNNKNRSTLIIKCHDYYKENREKVLLQMKEHRIKNRMAISNRRKVQYQEHHDERIAQRKEYVDKNRQHIRNRQAAYCSERRKYDIKYRVLQNIRSRILLALKNSSKHGKTVDLIGCTINKLRKHLESQFLPGMTWENYGLKGWHIDHKIPCAVFDLTKTKDQKKCFNYKNLQPMWWRDNLVKGSKTEEPFQLLLRLSA
jgi:hypothetical protein